MKPFVAVFSILLLSACQPIAQTNAKNADLESEGTSQANSQVISQTQVQGDFISSTLLKQAVDVDRIDSLMLVDNASKADDIKAQDQTPAVKEQEIEALVEAPLASIDPITLRLLELGAIALANQKLLTPEEDNANLYYQAALGREPDNKDAQTGLEEIVRFYTGWALDKAKQGHNRTAKKYLDSAIFVNANDPLIALTQQDIKNWRAGVRNKTNATITTKTQKKTLQNKFYLPKDLFSLSEALVIQKLQPIIDRIEKDQLNIEIFWPNDREARLLYQIINSRTEEFRVRGMIYRRTQHMIEVKQG